MRPDERQRLQDLACAVRQLMAQIETVRETTRTLDARLGRRKAEQIVLEARVDRLEKGPATRGRLPIPSGGSSSSPPSGASSPGDS